MSKKPQAHKAHSTELAPGITADEHKVVHVDVDIVYPSILKSLKLEGPLDQYKLEVIYQCAKMEVQRLVGGSEHDPRPDRPLRIMIEHANADSKEKWALKNHPEGKGWETASKGYEAREHYRRWRGFVPA